MSRKMINVKRIYEPPGVEDGKRFLVDRVWPRGLKRDSLALDGWLKEVAPSTALRRWFAHDPARWEEFKRRYAEELETQDAAVQELVEAAREGTVSLLYGARDHEHNNAVALKAYLEQRLRREA